MLMKEKDDDKDKDDDDDDGTNYLNVFLPFVYCK